jgi:site-specific DNA-methyltransferase (adenine-specific)
MYLLLIIQRMFGLFPLCHAKDAVILDPFCGTGTTLEAATLLGYHYIGMDQSSEYCKIAHQRLAALDTEQMDLFTKAAD